ncbi:cyclic lactone autoinducer peptide [Anaeromicropila populeti]|nr:cyclic lactone autoinducer peptide [Anaeromicropila populeti]
MIRSKSTSEKNIVKLTNTALKLSANSACFFWLYQPKLPIGLEKFKK